MKRIIVIALNTFKENLRDKILYNLVFFGLMLIGSSVLLGSLTMGEQAKIMKDLGLASINLFGVLIAIFVGIGLVSKEIEKRTIYTIIAKPIPRYQFLLGRYSGLGLTLFVNTAIMAVGFVLVLLLAGVGLDMGLTEAIGLIFLELLLIVAVAVMLSTFTTPTLSATFTLAIYVIGHLTGDLKALGDKLENPFVSGVLDVLYYALPNLSYFNIKSEAVHGIPIAWSYLLMAVSYGVTYAAFVMVAACMIFQRRDFK
jgi:ABC-type transport system involved in multi-copper enzyme maturation permease subunit